MILGVNQLTEHSLTNLGFLFMTIAYIRNSIYHSKNEYRKLLKSKKGLIQMNIELNNKNIELSKLVFSNNKNKNAIKSINDFRGQ